MPDREAAYSPFAWVKEYALANFVQLCDYVSVGKHYAFWSSCCSACKDDCGKLVPLALAHVDCGDNVIIINAEKIVFTGKKMTDKIYQRYTGYPGGQRETTPAKVLASHPERILEHAIRGMLPKNRLGDALYRNLHVYAGSEHPHQGQNPKVININDVR